MAAAHTADGSRRLTVGSMAAKSFVSSVDTVEPGEGVGPASALALDLVLLIAILRFANCSLFPQNFPTSPPGQPSLASSQQLLKRYRYTYTYIIV
jgi:hypothetical protein